MTGHILRDIVTRRYLLVTHGVPAKAHALHWELIFPASTARKKMFMFKVYMAENILGWVCLMWTLRGHLSGAMGRPLTSNIGPKTNQMTFVMKTVFTLLVSSRVMNTNGTMWIAQTATDLPARKVRALILLEKEDNTRGNLRHFELSQFSHVTTIPLIEINSYNGT